MNEDGEPARLPLLLPVAFLGLTLLTRLGNAVYWSGLLGGALLAALFVLPLLYALPRGRALWDRYRTVFLTAQVVLTYAPLALFGQDWINAGSGLLAGLILLTVAAPRSWLLFGAVIAAEAVRIAVLGIPWEGPKAAFVTWMLVAPVTTGLAFFGLVRLADTIGALRTARTELADLAVSQERRWWVDRLRAAIDELEAISAKAREALTALPGSPDQARTQLAEAAAGARQAAQQVRVLLAADDLPKPRTLMDAIGARVAPRVARLTLAVVLAGQAAILVSNIVVAGGPGLAMAGAVATIVVLAGLQLRHSLARPRFSKLTLAAQTLLPFAWLPAYDWNVLTLAGLAAGSALLLLPRVWGRIAFALVITGVGVAWTLPVLGVYYGSGNRSVYVVAEDNATVLYQMGAAATLGLVVYGLSRLTDLSQRLEAARQALARDALERERLRVAQDTHDLLGLGLSAVALKCDLAGRLIGRDEVRARAELEALLRLAGQSRNDLRAVTTGENEISLRAELVVAREILTSVGADVQVRVQPAFAFPEDLDSTLATVLREAVTNVLRHSEATRCEIELSSGPEIVLKVVNDGIADQAPEKDRLGGHGLTNLSARAAALGGRLSTHADGDRFELTVRVPSSPHARSDPSDRVDQDVRRPVLEQEP